MNLQWPILAALVAIFVSETVGRRWATVGAVSAVLFAVPVLFLLVPITELVWLALRFELAPVLATIVTVALVLTAPAIESLRHPNSWWAPLLGAVAAAGFTGIGILTGGPDADQPAPSTLVYAYEHGTGTAVWGGDADEDSLDATARAWAVDRAGAPLDELRDLSGFVYFASVPTAAAQVVEAQPPEVLVASDSIEGDTRHVELRVRSRIGAEFMAFLTESSSGTRITAIDGHEIVDPAAMARAEHFGEPDPRVELTLALPADEPIGLHVIEHLLRPEELLGEDAFARPETLAPNVSRFSDRAMFRYSVGAFADPRNAGAMPTFDAAGDTAGGGGDAGVAIDTLSIDAVAVDSTVTDTMGPDAPATDTIRADTLPIDTMPPEGPVADTVRSDALSTGAMQPDTLATDTIAGARRGG